MHLGGLGDLQKKKLERGCRGKNENIGFPLG